jgi:chromosome segregation ATPase
MSDGLGKYYSLPKEEVEKRVNNSRAKLMESVNKIQIEELKNQLDKLKRQIKDKQQLITISEAINLDALVVVLHDDLDLLVSQAFIIETEILRMEGTI